MKDCKHRKIRGVLVWPLRVGEECPFSSVSTFAIRKRHFSGLDLLSVTGIWLPWQWLRNLRFNVNNLVQYVLGLTNPSSDLHRRICRPEVSFMASLYWPSFKPGLVKTRRWVFRLRSIGRPCLKNDKPWWTWVFMPFLWLLKVPIQSYDGSLSPLCIASDRLLGVYILLVLLLE